MDLATIIGFVGVNILIIIVMNLAGSILMFWDFTSIIVVLGGSGFATLMRWPVKNYLEGLKAGAKAFSMKVDDPKDLINEIIELAQTARKSSILALEKAVIENRYLAKSVKYMVDGYDPAAIDSILILDINSMAQRHKDGRTIFQNMGDACPAFGMIGTVIGLIVIMANLDDPNAIGPGLAVALVTTLYGSLISNVFFLPMAQKLQFRSTEEMTNLMIIREGVRSILNGENPRAIQEKLESFLAPPPPA